MFTCGIGSTLNGSSVSVCDSNGSWNKLAPVCGKYLFYIIMFLYLMSIRPFSVALRTSSAVLRDNNCLKACQNF